ncbi:hypothetical protein [Flavobacterium sp.]|uniref:hypothetical protein n=1 Tax=Flavobacterium sp. TaxID=239 RepID=UPI0024889468|nr:hypothetical protein [Flavobacterium sp.]MDI1317529.1 hypothetical protein [Flavobacterium sp.]
MANKIYRKHNFHKHTFCIWKEVLHSEIADLKINYTSQSGSRYIFTEQGLYRISDHWGRVANCHWRLIPLAEFKSQHNIVAFAKWFDFYSNDDTSKLFFIKVDTETKAVNFYHKQSAEDQNCVFRNAKETAKTIRTLKEVLTETNWAKYLKYDDFEILRKKVVSELVNSDKSFLEIKKVYLV